MDEGKKEIHNQGPVQGQVGFNSGIVNINVGGPEVQILRPRSYLPFFRDPLFHERPREFERLEAILFNACNERKPVRLGLVAVTGMGGVGKTQLAVEVAYRYWDRFRDGIFWTIVTGQSLFDWQHQFAQLALNTGYLPSDDDPTKPDNERRRALHFCSFLANHKDALLILDNVEYPDQITSILPTLFGKEPDCTILYTSRNPSVPYGVIGYAVEQLPEPVALHLLLATTRPLVLTLFETERNDREVEAARDICHSVGYLPLALVHLRRLLERDQRIGLARLAKVLKQRGTFDIIRTLFETFRLSWKFVEDERAQYLFKLACYFPEATPIPLWLLGLATGLGENPGILEPLGEIYRQLHDASLFEVLSDDLVRLHPIVREFGKRLIAEDNDNEEKMREQAGERLICEFTNLNNLEDRAKNLGYRQCVEQVRIARDYLELLRGVNQGTPIRLIERWLKQEDHLFSAEKWWPQIIPGLFYQQLFNKTVEESYPTVPGKSPKRWILQENRVGAKDSALLGIFIGHEERINCVAFSPDGRRILTGSDDDTARLWDVQSGQELVRFIHSHDVVSIAFSSDGKSLLTGSFDATARLWETESGKELQCFGRHTECVNSVAFSLDGNQAWTGSYDGTVRLWSIADGRELQCFRVFRSKYELTNVAFSPNGRQALIGSDDGIVHLLSMTDGQELARLGRSTGNTATVAFSQDGNFVLIGSDGTILLYVVTNNGQLVQLKSIIYYGFDAVFSPNGRYILTISSDNTASVWEKSSGQEIVQLKGHSGGVISMAFSPDGKQVLTGSDDATARLWDVAKGEKPSWDLGHAYAINSLVFSSDGKRLVSSSPDGTAIVWDAINRNMLMRFKEFYEVSSVAFSPDGRKIVTGVWDRTAGIWDSYLGTELIRLEGHEEEILCVAFSHDGHRVLTGSHDKSAIVWDARNGEQLMKFKGHPGAIKTVAFSPNGKWISTGTDDHSVFVWDAKTAQRLNCFQGHDHWIISLAFSPDGSQILTGSADHTARIWDVENGRELACLDGHIGDVTCVGFSPKGHLMITCDDHGWVFFWNSERKKLGTLLGMYIASYEIGAIYWQDASHVWLADKGGPHKRPHVYRLQLEGVW